jgi:heme exporter protein B
MVFLNLLKQDLKNYCRNTSEIIVNTVFFLTISSVFLFFMQDIVDEKNNLQIFQVIIWIAIIFTIFYQSVDFLRQDYLDGTIEQMILICYNFEIYVLSKIIIFWLDFCLPVIIAIFFLMLIMGFQLNVAVSNVKVMIPATLAISAISFLCGCFNIISKRATLLAILALPLLIPLVVLAINLNFQTLSFLSLFMIVIVTFSSSKIIKIVSQ